MNEVIKIENKNSLKNTIQEAVNPFGGLSSVVGEGDRVLLKPNFNTADPFPASSDYEFLKTVVELVYEAGAKEVIVGDSCTLTQKTEKVMEKLHIYELEKLPKPATVMNFDDHEWIEKEIPGGKYLKHVSVPEILDKADKLILLPCLKTHFIAQFTGSLKLAVGFMKTIERVPLHTRHVQEKIAEMNAVINPDLIIMDGRKCFITRGPMDGETRESNVILASKSRVYIDIAGINIIKSFPGNNLADIEARDLPQIKVAKEIGIM